MDVADLVLDYINGLKWVVLVASALGWLFYRYHVQIGTAIASLANRPLNLKGFGLSAEVGAQAQGGVTPPDESSPKTPAPDGELAKLRTDYEALARDFINTRKAFYYEQVYRLIFGTQILLMAWLRVTYPAGAQPADSVEAYHQEYVNRATAARVPALTFDQYLHFLLTSQLIERSGAEGMSLTENGAGFLDYLSGQKLPLKPL